MFYIFTKEDNNLSEYSAIFPSKIKKKNGITYALYAWTKSKKDAEIFRKTRNMKLFFEKIIHIQKEDLEDFENKFEEERLSVFNYRGFGIGKENIRICYYQILTTTYEYDFMFECGVNLFEEAMNEIDINLLLNLHHIIKGSIYQKIHQYFDFENIYEYQVPIDEYPWRNYNFNQFESYIEMFKNTYKTGGVYKNAILSSL